MSKLNVRSLKGIASTIDQTTIPTGHTFTVAGDIIHNTTDAYTIPVGTTAQRPSSPAEGYLRFNTTNGRYEVWNAGDWKEISSGGSGTLGSFTNPAQNGIKLKEAGLASGYYWIQPKGYSEPRYCYVDNTNYDGGWVCVVTVGSGTQNHWNTFEADTVSITVDGQSTQYVPVSGNDYSSATGRRWDDCFIRDLGASRNGGDEVFNLRMSQNNAQPPGGVYDTYAGGTTNDWRYAAFARMNYGIDYYSSLNTGVASWHSSKPEGSFSLSHSYPYNWERPGGYTHIRTWNQASGEHKVWDFHSHTDSTVYQTSRYNSNRFLWAYTGASGNGIYGSGDAFNVNTDGNPGYMFVR